MKATINYYFPYEIDDNGTALNGTLVGYNTTIHDARTINTFSSQRPHLNTFGFDLVKCKPISEFKSIESCVKNKKDIYQYIVRTLKEMTGAIDVIPGAMITRISTVKKNLRNLMNVHNDAHCDFAPGTEQKQQLIDYLNNKRKIQAFDDYTGKHYNVNKLNDMDIKCINWWHPIKPVESNPLCVIDRRSLNLNEIFSIDFPEYNEEILSKNTKFCSSKHNDQHKWYYYSNMNPNENLLFVTYSSEDNWKPNLHSSFDLNTNNLQNNNNKRITSPSSPPPRESFEVRCICLFDKKVSRL